MLRTTEALRDLGRVLDAQGARWFLFGAQAAIFWGEPRATADLDITLDLSPEHAESLIQQMREAGFDCRAPDPLGVLERTRTLPFLHLATSVPVDIVLAGTSMEAGFFERAQTRQIGETTIHLISPEDLLVTKVLAGRPKDLQDVRGVLREQKDSLNLTWVREQLDFLEQALDRRDLLRELDRAVESVDDAQENF